MAARAEDTDVLIIGAGHNGLVCAFYLARAGLKVTMLERRAVVGGAAVTEAFHPGFRNSVASYTVSLLNPTVGADMTPAGLRPRASVDRRGPHGGRGRPFLPSRRWAPGRLRAAPGRHRRRAARPDATGA